MNMIRFVSRIWLAGAILAAGCGAPKPVPDPLAGWRPSSIGNLNANKIISDDYQRYIKNLPPERSQFVGTVDFFEDGTGQHAVKIRMGVNGAWWEHVLFYDRNDSRIKIIKYSTGGGYRS
jgi:hypothetical protein